jgi:hypothetical protein
MPGAQEAANTDPYTALTTDLLANFLHHFEIALEGEHLDPAVEERIIERVVYGALPNPEEVRRRLGVEQRLIDTTAKLPPAPTWSLYSDLVKWRTS